MPYDESLRKPPPADPDVTLWRFMVAAKYQRQGIGVRASKSSTRAPQKRFLHVANPYVPGPNCPEPFTPRSASGRPGAQRGEIVLALSLLPRDPDADDRDAPTWAELYRQVKSQCGALHVARSCLSPTSSSFGFLVLGRRLRPSLLAGTLLAHVAWLVPWGIIVRLRRLRPGHPGRVPRYRGRGAARRACGDLSLRDRRRQRRHIGGPNLFLLPWRGAGAGRVDCEVRASRAPGRRSENDGHRGRGVPNARVAVAGAGGRHVARRSESAADRRPGQRGTDRPRRETLRAAQSAGQRQERCIRPQETGRNRRRGLSGN